MNSSLYVPCQACKNGFFVSEQEFRKLEANGLGLYNIKIGISSSR